MEEEKKIETETETETETDSEKEKETEAEAETAPVRETEPEDEAEVRNARRKRSPLSLIEKVRAYLARHYIPEAAEEATEDATADPTADAAFAAPLPVNGPAAQAGTAPAGRGGKKKKPRMAAGGFGKKLGAKKDSAAFAESCACSAEAAENGADRDAGRRKEAFIAPDAVQAVPPHLSRTGESGVPAGTRPAAPEAGREDEIRRIIEGIDEGFALKLMRLIDRRGMDDVTCYKKAGVSRQTWYKIMNDGDYRPGKKTVLAFAFALELTLEETQALLGSVGLTLSRSSKFDVIVEYFLKARNYDTAALDDVLFSFDQETLMSVGL